MITLKFQAREAKAKPEAVRATGMIPAVFYGPKEKSTSIALSMVDFKKAWKKAGESSVIVLTDGKSEHEALIHDVDVHPVTGVPRHADFYVIEKGKKVQVRTPISFEGTAPAIKDKGGILVKVMRELEIEAAPKDLPHEIVVDVSGLMELNSAIKASEVKLPAGVTLVTKPDDIVASISEAKEEVEAAPTAIDMSSIEVAAKGKEAKEGEAPAEGAAAAPAKEDKKPEKK